jgi:Restriction Enzyme Adenine Methylase Associated
VRDVGAIRLEDDREFPSPSRAAVEAAGIPAYDGWYAWRLDGGGGESLHELRLRVVNENREEEAAEAT